MASQPRHPHRASTRGSGRSNWLTRARAAAGHASTECEASSRWPLLLWLLEDEAGVGRLGGNGGVVIVVVEAEVGLKDMHRLLVDVLVRVALRWEGWRGEVGGGRWELGW